MKKFLQHKRKGVSTFEWALTLPFTLLTLFIVFYIMLLIFSWVSYGGVASNIAKDLNMRSTGLIQVNKDVGGSDVVASGKTGYGRSYTITRDQITINGQEYGDDITNSYKNAVVYHMREYGDALFFPYTQFKNVDVSILQMDKSGSYSKVFTFDKTLSNYIIKVDIHYEYSPLRIMKMYNALAVPLSSTGYGIIT